MTVSTGQKISSGKYSSCSNRSWFILGKVISNSKGNAARICFWGAEKFNSSFIMARDVPLILIVSRSQT